MKKKKIIGIIIIAHIFPCSFMILSIVKGEILEYGYLIPYMGGWAINIILLTIYALIRFLEWCFEN